MLRNWSDIRKEDISFVSGLTEDLLKREAPYEEASLSNF